MAKSLLSEDFIGNLRKEFLFFTKNLSKKDWNMRDKEIFLRALKRWKNLLSQYGAQIREEVRIRVREGSLTQGQADRIDREMKDYYELIREVILVDLDDSKWENRVKVRARKAWISLRNVMEALKSLPTVMRRHEEENFSIEGFQVQFYGFDADTSIESPFSKVHQVLRDYKRSALNRFPILVKRKLPIVVSWSFKEFSGDAAGRYMDDHIEITPWSLASPRDEIIKTLAHEMGHHVWRTILSTGMQDFWTSQISRDQRKMNLRDVIKKMEKHGETSFFSRTLASKDPILFLHLEELGEVLNMFSIDDIQKYLSSGENPEVMVSSSPITGYSRKNPEEAFCEAIGKLVAYGPNSLPDRVLGWLNVLFPSDVHFKMASRSLVRR